MMDQYNPTTISPPGETLLDTLNALGMTQADLANRTGRSPKMINEIIKGKAPITPETALQFEMVLGVPASFWNNREKNFREYLARKSAQIQLKSQISWLGRFPVEQMINFGWLPSQADKVQQVSNLLSFFGVGHHLHWGRIYRNIEVAYRKAYEGAVSFNSLTAWLRAGELAAQGIVCQPFSDKKFPEALGKIRSLTVKTHEEFVPEMKRLCADAGVAVVFTRELPKLNVFGATRWLTAEKALIQLSLIYRTNDELWFTFFHEAAHISLHGKKDVFVEGANLDNQKEDEANKFAGDLLIPRKELLRVLQNENPIGRDEILRLAFECGIAPGIVVGRLQHEKKVPYHKFNELKTRFEWKPS